MTVLGVRGDLIRGHNEGVWTSSRPRWVTTADWLGGQPATMPPDEARATVVGTWLQDVRARHRRRREVVLRAHPHVGARGAARRRGGRGGPARDARFRAARRSRTPNRLADPWCALLPGLDVTTMGWQDRDWYLGAHRGEVFDRNGNAGPTVWCDGRVVGGWRQDADGRVELQLLEPVGRPHAKGLERQANRAHRLAGRRTDQPALPVAVVEARLRRRDAQALTLRRFLTGAGTVSISARKCPV